VSVGVVAKVSEPEMIKLHAGQDTRTGINRYR
jgi:hypothetical protein